ncbi:MAG: YafY family protein [Sulfitobacter sp.]
MTRADRLFDLLQVLRDERLYTAQALATRLGVSVRTIYRDMDTLAASGVAVHGARGVGYRLPPAIRLPPLTLTEAELEALNLGLAIAMEVADADLKSAATTLTEKLDAVLPQTAVAQADAWKFALTPFADAARGFAHMPLLRAAIKARQKLRLTYTSHSGAVTSQTVRPLHMEYLGRIWTLTAWCELRAAHHVFRLDLMTTVEALPELFSDEAGKMLSDYRP